jgi:hypothetical protein
MKTVLKVMLGVVLAGVLLIVGCAVLVGSAAEDAVNEVEQEADAHALTPAEFRSIQKGSTIAEVKGEFGEPESSDNTESITGKGRDRCLYYNQKGADLLEGESYQLCFEPGKLRAKKPVLMPAELTYIEAREECSIDPHLPGQGFQVEFQVGLETGRDQRLPNSGTFRSLEPNHHQQRPTTTHSILFTRERSLVRNQPRPSEEALLWRGFSWSGALPPPRQKGSEADLCPFVPNAFPVNADSSSA